MLVGTSLNSLSKLFAMNIDKVVLLGSIYALGRIMTVYITGKMVEKYGPLKILTIGIVLIMAYFLVIPLTKNYYLTLVLAFFAGMGMGAQDTVCPLLLSMTFPKSYASSLSGGQALFGLGGFAISLLVGIMLGQNLPFYYTYYVFAIVGAIMLIMIPFAHYEKSEVVEEKDKQIKPLYTKNKIFALGVTLLACFLYCTIVNALSLYTTTFAEEMMISASNAAYLLTLYNIGCVIGSLLFIIILKKIQEKTVLFVNSIVGFITLLTAIYLNTALSYAIGLFIIGIFMGVLFSVVIAIATRIEYQHVSVAGSKIAIAGGGADVLTPIWTGLVVSSYGVGWLYRKIIYIILGLILVAGIILVNTKEERYANSK